ncbi:MFS transporter [Paraburkholderia sp. J67]|uniref:MFS transporter n=1 Tax=Paraburkholderia sp. J67 TaxID=2805435 RepID=UPI002ABDF0F6|nr:MFS transporter [Paraburkholderia sp. J67]
MTRNSAPWGVVAILFATFGTLMLDRMSQLFLGPYLVEAMHLTQAQIGLLASVVGVCWAISALVFGAVSDRFGRRAVLIPAVLVFSACSWLSGLANDFGQLLAIRALLGLAEGPCYCVIMALAEAYARGDARGRTVGIVNSAGALVGSAIAPVFTTQVASAFGWRWGFFAAGIPGLVLAVLIWVFVHEPAHVERGARERLGFGEYRLLLTNRNLWCCLVANFGLATYIFAFSVFSPLYITQRMGQAPTVAGFLLGASGLGGFLWSFFGTGLSDRIGRRKTVLGAALLCCLQPLLFMYSPLYQSPWLLAALALATMAAPACAALMMVLIPVESVPGRFAAAAIGFAGLGTDFLGGTVSPALGGGLAQRFGLGAPMMLSLAGALLLFAMALLLRMSASAQAATVDEGRLLEG